MPVHHPDKQEIFCHGCSRFVQFILNFEIDGQYQIDCPNCGHEHFRVIRDGRITDDRWRSSMGNVYTQVYGSTSSVNSTTTASGGSMSYYSSTSATGTWS